MRLAELANTQAVNKQAEQAWDSWDAQIQRDLDDGKLDGLIQAAKDEAETAEAL